MSEELIQRGLTQHGLAFGPYEFYNIGQTTIGSLKTYGIIPNKSYTGFSTKKPDALLVDRRVPTSISVVAVIEYKAVNEFDTEAKKQEATRQCVEDYCKPLGAKIGIVTDRQQWLWVNPQVAGNNHSPILREDGYPLHLPFGYDDEPAIVETLTLISRVLSNITPDNSQLLQEQFQNPSNLADRVWQTIWLASGENPDACIMDPRN